ncbi:NAD(+)--dinitrogen-reductase ADP-D-ribosyltransferase [Vibrio viridaestus]|nr:NAD(+)--dinitrogen-reductase ADP-D-ribosyltransferase [Vibrio viridaestus]
MSDTTLYEITQEEAQYLKRLTVSLNRINIPSALFASLSYQSNPIPVELDGVSNWYAQLFADLKGMTNKTERYHLFSEFMSHRFSLKANLQADREEHRILRSKLSYKRIILGWLFDSNSEQGAALRGWVESRFGLQTNYHSGLVADSDSDTYWAYRQKWHKATHNTNELFAQLDLLYCYCQLELSLLYPHSDHVTLYRGCINSPEIDSHPNISLMSNISSFTFDPETAMLFGSKLYEVSVPLWKIVCFDDLLPGSLAGENEYLVLGGLYKTHTLRL